MAKLMTGPSQEETRLKKIIPFKEIKFEEYFLKAMRNEFPELVKSVSKEYKQRSEHFEIM